MGPTYPFRGGIAHFNSLMCGHLGQRHEVVAFGFRRMYPRWLFPGRSDRDPSQEPLRTPSVRSLDPINPWSWMRTAKCILVLRPDTVIFHWWVTFWSLPFAVVAWCLRQRKVPVLFLCHNVLPHEARLWDRPLAALALRQGDGYIVMADSEAAQLRAIVPNATVYQLPLPTYVELARLSEAPPTDEARRLLGLDPADPVALFFGFVRPYKGLQFLLRAMPAVREHHNLQLVIAGEFWHDKQVYLDVINELGIADAVRVEDRYIANEEMGTYFAAADVVVLPYVDVTQSAVVQLAFGFGKPVVTTRVGNLPDVVEHGRTGLIVPPGDADALARALRIYFDEGLAGKMAPYVAAAQDRFSWRDLEETIGTAVIGVRRSGI